MTYINIHALHTLPPSNANRDDTQAPKTAMVGGVLRGRLSSQSQKRVARLDAQQKLPAAFNAVRTRELVSELAKVVAVQHPDVDSLEVATAAATRLGLYKSKKKKGAAKDEEDTAADTGSAQALYYSVEQLAAFAMLAPEIAAAKGKPGDETSKKYLEAVMGGAQSAEIALFGRMVADSNISVEAAVQTAHAFAVHATHIESDYYTFVDDIAEGSGAAHLGTTGFYSATFYRYANINVEQLVRNFSPNAKKKDVEAAISVYVKSWLLTLPQGHATQFAHSTLPDFIALEVTNTPFTWTNAVNTPVSQTNAVAEAVKRFDQFRLAHLATYPKDVVSTGLFTTSIDPANKLADAVTGNIDETIIAMVKKANVK